MNSFSARLGRPNFPAPLDMREHSGYRFLDIYSCRQQPAGVCLDDGLELVRIERGLHQLQ